MTLKTVRRLLVAVIGSTLVLFGIALLVLPGPGLVVIAIGLTVLAAEFVWARRLLKRVKDELVQQKNRLQRKPPPASPHAEQR